jgi:Zn-dependent protease
MVSMPAVLGLEWCHNLAHVYISQLIGKPMDELQILWGMPRCVYYDLNDPTTTPREHIMRSLGGPLFNLTALPLLGLARGMTERGSLAREVADLALRMDVFLSVVSLLPIPGIDGGPVLKWSLVERGATIREADETVRKVNGVLGLILGIFSWLALKKKRRSLGILSILLSVLSFGVFTRLIKEEEVPF